KRVCPDLPAKGRPPLISTLPGAWPTSMATGSLARETIGRASGGMRPAQRRQAASASRWASSRARRAVRSGCSPVFDAVVVRDIPEVYSAWRFRSQRRENPGARGRVPRLRVEQTADKSGQPLKVRAIHPLEVTMTATQKRLRWMLVATLCLGVPIGVTPGTACASGIWPAPTNCKVTGRDQCPGSCGDCRWLTVADQ